MESDAKAAVNVGYHIPTCNDWAPMAKEYHPLQAGSIDGTDTVAHDRAVIRAMQAKYRPNKSVTGNPRKTLFIGRLTRDTKEDTIRERFSDFGKLESCHLIRDIGHTRLHEHDTFDRAQMATHTSTVTGLSRGYAFVEYENEWDARSAWKEMHKMEINGAIIIVEYEAERNLKGWIPRRLGGGWGGKKESGQLRFGGRDRQFRRPLPLHAMGLSQRWGGSRDNKRDFRHDSGHDRGKGGGGDWGRQSWRREERDRRSSDDNYRSQARDRDRDRRRFVE